MFWIENIHHGKKEQVTEEQWATLQKMFPNQFRKIKSPANYSADVYTIINEAEGKEASDDDQGDTESE